MHRSETLVWNTRWETNPSGSATASQTASSLRRRPHEPILQANTVGISAALKAARRARDRRLASTNEQSRRIPGRGRSQNGFCLVGRLSHTVPKAISKKVKERIAVNGFPSHSYGTSLDIWDHTVLPATRHKLTSPRSQSLSS